ncbi:MAG: hypothetical protein HY279_08685 [Nitrospinae bacterium]|nr:hypothetical protein [Nitrospinota bacterium]
MKDNFQNPTDIDKKILLCWKCGFPNKIGDTRCMFCRVPLEMGQNLFSRLEIFLDRKKEKINLWRKGELLNAHRRSNNTKRFIPLIIGAILFSIGCYLFVAAVFTTSFTKWLIAILFLIYGIFSMRFFLRGKQKKVSDLYDQRPFS